jgi:hypothetical protein
VGGQCKSVETGILMRGQIGAINIIIPLQDIYTRETLACGLQKT